MMEIVLMERNIWLGEFSRTEGFALRTPKSDISSRGEQRCQGMEKSFDGKELMMERNL